jgi:hypothetical protein
MIANVDVHTGKRTVLQYLLKALDRAKEAKREIEADGQTRDRPVGLAMVALFRQRRHHRGTGAVYRTIWRRG